MVTSHSRGSVPRMLMVHGDKLAKENIAEIYFYPPGVIFFFVIL
jgi:hypothetical protein